MDARVASLVSLSPPPPRVKARHGRQASTLAPGPADDNNNENNKHDYDPRCGMSKEEFEWRCAEYDRVRKRMPQALHELRMLTDDMCLHFGGDLHAIRKWDEYEKSVHDSFAGFLQDSLASPLNTPNSVLYAQLMRREAHKRSFAGRLDRLKNAAAAMSKRIGRAEAMVAAGILGLTVGSTLTLLWTKQQETKET